METEFEHAGFKVKIEQDSDPQSPREWSTFGTMVCFHKRYNLGDKHDYKSENFNGWDALEKQLEKDGAAIALPLYLYDHSGLRMKVGSFAGHLPGGHAEWDSGQVGFIFVTRETIKKELNVKRIGPKQLADAERILRSEVECYDQYLSGDVWQYSIEDEDGEHVDSCCGFYGAEYCEKEARAAAESAAQYRAEKASALALAESSEGAGI